MPGQLMRFLPKWLRSGRVAIGLVIIGVIGLCAIFAPCSRRTTLTTRA